jgi:hypothetical protein
MLASAERHPRYWLLYEKRQKHDEIVLCLYLTLKLFRFEVNNNNSKIGEITVLVHFDTSQFRN